MDSPKEAVKVTQELIDLDADVIKISIEDDLQGNTWELLTLEEIQSITNTAHEGNRWVATHITHVHNLRLAIDGGVDELSYMVVESLSDELSAEIADKGIYWVPTLELWQK